LIGSVALNSNFTYSPLLILIISIRQLAFLINGNGFLAAFSLQDDWDAQVYVDLVNVDQVWVALLTAMSSSFLVHMFIMHIIGEMFILSSCIISF